MNSGGEWIEPLQDVGIRRLKVAFFSIPVCSLRWPGSCLVPGGAVLLSPDRSLQCTQGSAHDEEEERQGKIRAPSRNGASPSSIRLVGTRGDSRRGWPLLRCRDELA